MTTTSAPGRRIGGRWIDHWDPEDEGFWQRTGSAIWRSSWKIRTRPTSARTTVG